MAQARANPNVLYAATGVADQQLDSLPGIGILQSLNDGLTWSLIPNSVAIFNDRGRLEVVVRISDRVRPGVVCLPSGYWASRSPGGLSVNALTNDALTDRGGGSALHSTLVEVEALTAV